MPRKTSAIQLVIAWLLLVAASALGTGNGDYCVHLSNGITGPDTALIGFVNTFEIWIANDDLLGGMSSAIEITFEDTLVWDMDYGSHPPVNEEGRAVGAWNLPGLQVADIFDNVSPEILGLGGAAMPDAGLPAGPSELCYSLRFTFPAGPRDSLDGLCVHPYSFPVPSWNFNDPAGGYLPDFCGQPVISELFPDVEPICFPVIELPWICGDADENGIVNISDAIYILWVIFGTPPPEVTDRADVDCNEILNVSDVVYLIAYVFAGGPEPCAECP